jgi:hypothetical protein
MSKKKPLVSGDSEDDLVKQVTEEIAAGPALPLDTPAAALAAIDDWNEEWLAILDPPPEDDVTEAVPPKKLALSSELERLIERTNYLARWCESSGLDSSPLVQFAQDVQGTYLGLRPTLPSVPTGFWVLLDRLKFKLQPVQSQPSVGSASVEPTAQRKPIPDPEAESLVEMFLKKKPGATAREVADGVGIALGRVPEMRAWRRVLAQRKAAKQVKPKKARQLSKRMEHTIGKEADPAKRIELEEAIWQRLLEEADEEGRANLHEMTKAAKAEMIQLKMGELEEELEQRQRERRGRGQEDYDCS